MIPISYNIRSLQVRRTTTLAAVLGIALVVFVFSASLMLKAGVDKTLGASGKADHSIVIRKGSDGELASSVDTPTISLIGAAPGVRKDAAGQPVAIGEIMSTASLQQMGETNKLSNVVIRGVPEAVWAFRPEVKFTQGRAPKTGTDEAAVGKRIYGRFEGVVMGKTVDLRKNRPVTIVGVFEAGGGAFESELWADLDVVAQAFGRSGAVSSVRVQLESATAFDAFDASVESDKRLGLEAIRETEYYEKQSEGTAGLTSAMGSVISFFFALGAIVGAMITMYASIAHRKREIGTLRAIGFPRWQILVSFLFESIVVSVLGGLVGAMASLALGTVEFPLMNMTNWSEMVFKFTPTAETLTIALVVSGVMGLVGGFLPALQAARMSTLQAMKD